MRFCSVNQTKHFVNAETNQIQSNAFDGPGDGILGRLNRRLGPSSPVPSLFRRHHSGQLSMAASSRSFHQAPLFRPLRCASLLSLIWLLFQPPFLGPHVPGLCFDAPLPSPLRLDYLLARLWLSHWMVSDLLGVSFVIRFNWVCYSTEIDRVLEFNNLIVVSIVFHSSNYCCVTLICVESGGN